VAEPPAETTSISLSTTADRPWRDYFYCPISGNRDDANNYPIATRRALCAMHMHRPGLIEHSPNTLVNDISDWRFLTESKQEPKA
jgi:hypothetical protein